ncbi:MAG TPA: hypothetical protein VM661_01835 [Candidatus Sulfotelmatobacter sp.]|jgi:hypothetical protein|nr:hypothetical protein [Candidatus Sulfotelmatobacter sp.]
MSHQRVETFQMLVDRASDLLTTAERDGECDAVAEAALILEYLRKHYVEPFDASELDHLLHGSEDEQRAVRVLLDGLRLKRLIKTLADSPPQLLAAE